MNHNYSEKENYITACPDVSVWKNHPNYFLLQHYKEYIHGSCCDIGCNHGACTLHLLEFRQVTQICGIDINQAALEVACELAAKASPSIPISYYVANIVDNKFDENTFDFIMSFHCLEHIYPDDIDNVVKGMYRTLKHDRFVLISIPYDHAYPDPQHVAFYTVDTLCDLFERNGFETIECMKDNRWNEKNLLTGIFYKPKNIENK